MRRIISIAFLAAVFAISADAQSNLKKVYNEDADPMAQISDAVKKAGKEGKYVICQVGGNWCRWCP